MVDVVLTFYNGEEETSMVEQVVGVGDRIRVIDGDKIRRRDSCKYLVQRRDR